jgi:hypothetical protein
MFALELQSVLVQFLAEVWIGLKWKIFDFVGLFVKVEFISYFW